MSAPWSGELRVVRYPDHASDVFDANDDVVLEYSPPAYATELVRRANAHPKLVEALEDIAEGKGAFSQDPLTHASNCIEEMKATAREALAAIQEEDDES